MEGEPQGIDYQQKNESPKNIDQANSYLSQAIDNGISIPDLQKAIRSLVNRESQNLPVPDSITPEVRENMKDLKMDLFFTPTIDFGMTRDIHRPFNQFSLKRPDYMDSRLFKIEDKGIEKYLSGLEKRYPTLLRRYEGLTEDQQKDPSVWRNLDEHFYKAVRYGQIDFPELKSKWMIVETIPKPDKTEDYQPSPITEILGFSDRFNKSYKEVVDAISKNKEKILSALGLKSGEVRLLTAVEWNYLANIEGWGATNTYELTNTLCRIMHSSGQLIGPPVVTAVGNYNEGGAAATRSFDQNDSYDHSKTKVGFRIAVIP